MPENQALYKKALFLSAKRALPENEIILTNFIKKVVQSSYDDRKLQAYIDLIDGVDDLTLYNLITGISPNGELSPDFQEIVNDINRFIKNSLKLCK